MTAETELSVVSVRAPARAPVLPRLIRQEINRRSHAEAVAYEAQKRQELAAEAKTMLDTGTPLSAVLEALRTPGDDV